MQTFPKVRITSIQVNQLPLVHLLEALALENELSFDVDDCGLIPVSLHQSNIEINDLLRRIEDIARVRTELIGNRLSLRCDLPYARSYFIDYPAVDRQTLESVSLNAGVGANAGASAGLPGTGGAPQQQLGGSLQVQNRHTNRFWEQLVNTVENILAAEEDLTEPIKITETELSRNESGIVQAPPDRRYGNAQTPPKNSVYATNLDNTTSKTTTNRTESRRKQVSAHPESGLLNVRANHRQHKLIERFIAQAKHRSLKQVEVEATLVEVRLSRQFQQGIQWTNANREYGKLGFKAGSALLGNTTGLILSGQSREGQDLSFALRLLEQYGEVKVLSNPRVAVLNQQTALMKMVENRVYFTVSAQAVPASANSAAFATFNTQAHTVPVGFVMSLTPSIENSDAITLTVRPSLSRIVGFVGDPNPALAQAGVQSKVPEIQTREIESMLRLKNGDIALLGGFIQSEGSRQFEGIPGTLANHPLHFLTGSEDSSQQQTELVVLLKPKLSNFGAPLP
jgi:general secretion pathway protein D